MNPVENIADASLAHRIVFGQLDGEGTGLLVSADGEGRPHATWMATVAATEERQFVTLTSPDSRKVANIRANDKVEWLFSTPDKMQMVYANGTARIILSPEEIRHYWNLMKQKERAFFLDSYNSGMGFAIIRTDVEQVSLVFPEQNRKVEIEPEDFWKAS